MVDLAVAVIVLVIQVDKLVVVHLQLVKVSVGAMVVEFMEHFLHHLAVAPMVSVSVVAVAVLVVKERMLK
jgi:imidazoleglycerol phosphate dehydratase HisB